MLVTIEFWKESGLHQRALYEKEGDQVLSVLLLIVAHSRCFQLNKKPSQFLLLRLLCAKRGGSVSAARSYCAIPLA